MNPKDVVGKTKPPIGLIPATALVECAMVAKHSQEKYPPFNWREHPIEVMEYVHAIYRHLLAFADGETHDAESGRHHLAHAMLTCGIVIDAEAYGTCIDNRPTGRRAGELIRQNTVPHHDSQGMVDGR